MDKVALLTEKMKQAFKAGDRARVRVLKMLLSQVKNRQIELKGQNKELSEGDFAKLVLKAIKTRQEAISAYQKAGREELQKKEEAELAVLREFAPRQLGENEVRERVKAVVAQLKEDGQALNFGMVMKQTMAELKGKADGSLVSKVVRGLVS